MILVDSSVWVDHLRRGDAGLAALLDAADVAVHPFIVGELACGSLRRPGDVIRLLNALPSATSATHDEVMHFIATHRLAGRGIGYVDAHLLASASIDRLRLWTRDKALRLQSASLGLAYQP